MPEPYDLVAIGSGVAATAVISQVAKAGWRTAVIDYQPFGGTCALRGCDPKKMMVSSEEALSAFRRMYGHGISGELHIDWADLQRFKRSFIYPIPAKREKDFANLGADTFHGRARFVNSDTIEVDGQRLLFRHALIATGARPVPLKIAGEELVRTSDDFLELDELPKRTLFVGGGYIAAEFSHLAARAGADVTVVQRGPRLLPHFDADMVELLLPRFEKLGISIHTDAKVVAIARAGEAFRVTTRGKHGEQTFEVDLVVHAAGRRPDLDDLDLAAARIAVDRGRLTLSDRLQSTSNPRIFAAGDSAAKGPPLTPVSAHDAKVVAANLLGTLTNADYRAVPSVVFTVPALASVGLTERQARERKLDFNVHCRLVPEWFTARRLAEPIYGHKILLDHGSDQMLGAHLVGPHAEEVINLFALAIRQNLTVHQLKETMFAYPTGASDVGAMLS